MAIDTWLLTRVRASLPDRDLPNTKERRSEFMRRLPQFDEDDFQGLIDKLAAAEVDDTVGGGGGGGNAVGGPSVPTNCQTFSIGSARAIRTSGIGG